MTEHRISPGTAKTRRFEASEPTISTTVSAKKLQALIDRHAQTVEDFQSYLTDEDWHRWLNVELHNGALMVSLTTFGERLLIAQIVAAELVASGDDPEAKVGGRL